MINVYTILLGKPQGKTPLGRPWLNERIILKRISIK
jgi:hypothetical protein